MGSPASPDTIGPNNILLNFASKNRNLFPLLARVIGIGGPELSTVAENNRLETGSHLVLHGWSRQSKVMATSGKGYFAIPLSYQGEFRFRRKIFHGLLEFKLEHQRGKRMSVVEVNPRQRLPVRPGDIITMTGDGEKTIANSNQSDGSTLVSFEKYDATSGRASEIFLSISADITLEEVIDGIDHGRDTWTIHELSECLTNKPFDVELVRPSCDQPPFGNDLPLNTIIRLVEVVAEPAVFASIQLPDNPAFHIPMRTLIYVRFQKQLARESSPLLSKQRPKMSTYDRCIEILSEDVYYDVLKRKHTVEAFTKGLPLSSQQRYPVGSTLSGGSHSQMDLTNVGKSRRGSSVAGSVVGGNNSKWSRFSASLKRHVSTEHLKPYRSSISECGSESSFATGSQSKKYSAQIKAIKERNRAQLNQTTLLEKEHDFSSHEAIQSMTSNQNKFSTELQTNENVNKSVALLQDKNSLENSELHLEINKNKDQNILITNLTKSQADVQDIELNANTSVIGSKKSANGGSILKESSSPSNNQGNVVSNLALEIPSGFRLVQLQSPAISQADSSLTTNGHSKSKQVTFNKNDMNNNNSDDSSDDSPNVYNPGKLSIPPDGNLYSFSAKKFTEFLLGMNIAEDVMKSCRKKKIDGKIFSRMTEEELEQRGLMQPLIVYFKKRTLKTPI